MVVLVMECDKVPQGTAKHLASTWQTLVTLVMLWTLFEPCWLYGGLLLWLQNLVRLALLKQFPNILGQWLCRCLDCSGLLNQNTYLAAPWIGH